VLSLYLPGTQPVQLPSVPVQPALQKQEEMCSLSISENEFGPHIRHFDLSSVVYEPAAQSKQPSSDNLTCVPDEQSVHATEKHWEHVFPFPTSNPALHLQLLRVMLPAGEFEADVQRSQVADPKADLYVPVPHT